MPFLVLLLLALLPGALPQGCPSVCICKWKNGKQTAECVNRSLSTLPKNLSTDTQVLDLNNNPLGRLQSRVFQENHLVNLQKVFLASCSLSVIERDAFYQLSNLVELDLSQNYLADVPTSVFADTSQLRRLSLENNSRIERLSADAFANLTYLNALDISNCKIADISPGAFRGLGKLEVLKLNGNRLTVLTTDVLRTLPPLYAFSLYDNPWRCDCHLRDLRVWMTDNNVPLGIPPKCSEPSSLEDQSWAVLALEKFACLPKIVSIVREVSVSKGDNATLECRVQATPPATILWETGGVLLNNDSVIHEYSEHISVESGVGYSLLIVEEALVATSYVCLAENEAGIDIANFTLSVVYAPEASVSWGKGKVMWVALGIFLAAVIVVLIVGCIVALRYRALTSNEGKFNGVGILKQLAAKKAETVEVRASDKPNDITTDKAPRHETGSSGYGSDQHTPDLTNKAEMQNGPTYSTKAFLYSHPVHGSLTKETYNIHEQCCPPPSGTLLRRENFHGYSNEFPGLAGYHDGYPDVQYSSQNPSGSDSTFPPCDLVQDNRCRVSDSYSENASVRDDSYVSPALHVWKRTPLVVPPEFDLQPTGDRRYSPDEGYAEETLEGTEV